MDWFFKKEMHFYPKSLIWILYYGLNNYQEIRETGPPKGFQHGVTELKSHTLNLHQVITFNYATQQREVWCHVTLVATTMGITTMGSFCNGNGKQQKSNRFRLGKEQLCTSIMLFCTFLSLCCTTATWNFLISLARRRLMGYVNTTQKCSFSFSKPRYGPFGFNPENFANIWQIKRN